MLHRRSAPRRRERSIGDEAALWLTKTHAPPLTDRQQDVLRRLAAGQQPSRIAAELGLSRQRVYQIVAAVRRKVEGDPRRRA